MKSKVLLIFIPVAIMLASCSKDDPQNGPIPEIGEESVVTLTIYDATRNTRAAGVNTEAATPSESAVDPSDGIKVVVFNENGTLDYSSGTLTLTETSSGSGIYQTDEFKLISGNKYFYIFVNDRNNKITLPTDNTMDRHEFIAQTAAAALDGSDVLNLTTPNFLMGTLWSEKNEAPRGGVAGDPKKVPLTIGRLVSKVTLNGISKGTSTMDGVFSSPSYRLGSIPKKIFIAGHNDEALNAPPAAGHGIVISAVHDAPIYSGAGDLNFYQYSDGWKNVDGSNPESFYTVENTTAPDGFGMQYYGNTSYIQIRTVYTPDDGEVYKVDDLSPKGSFTGGTGTTFYTANLLSTGVRLIFEEDPRTLAGNNPHADIDQTSILVYTDGINYHKFPIHDPEAGLPDVQKNTVLRNHSYLYTVTSIGDLGSPGESVPPTEPIESETTLYIEVTILPWSKIENTNVPI